MSKIQVFFLSLVGALPAGFLSYLLGMYLISQPSGASSMVMIISIITLICSATLTLTPFLILAMYYSNYDPPKVAKKPKSKAVDDELDEVDDTEEVPAKKSRAKGADVDEFADDEPTEEATADDDDSFATMDDDELATDDEIATMDDDDMLAMDDDEEK